MTALAAISDKLDLLRTLENEHGFGTVVAPGAELLPIPALPARTIEVFSLFSQLGGTNFVFEPPPEIATPTAWEQRAIVDYCPLNNPLSVGHEARDASALERADGLTGGPIRMDLDDGGVYWIEPDDYVFLYKNPDEEVDMWEFAPDIVTFFDEYVLGSKYPELVTTVLGPHEALHRPKKAHYEDSWMRLLAAAGLVS